MRMNMGAGNALNSAKSHASRRDPVSFLLRGRYVFGRRPFAMNRMKLLIRADRPIKAAANSPPACENKHDCDYAHERIDAHDPPLQTPEHRSPCA